MLLQLILGCPSRAINALQHFVLVVTTPIGASQFHQLEVLELAGAGHVRATAQVFKLAFTVKRHILVGRDAFNDFGLVKLTQALEISHCLITRQHATCHGFVQRRQRGHFFLDGGEVLEGERTLVRKVVEKAVFNHWANGDLCVRKKLLDGVRQQVRCGMANHFQSLWIFGSDDGQRAVFVDHKTGVHDLAIDPARKSGFGQTRANGGCHICHRDR